MARPSGGGGQWLRRRRGDVGKSSHGEKPASLCKIAIKHVLALSTL